MYPVYGNARFLYGETLVPFKGNRRSPCMVTVVPFNGNGRFLVWDTRSPLRKRVRAYGAYAGLTSLKRMRQRFSASSQSWLMMRKVPISAVLATCVPMQRHSS